MVISGGGPIGVPATVVAVTSNMYSVSAGSATGGSFTLSVDGGLATAPIAWNALAADVATALTNAGVATNSVTGTGTLLDPWVIAFTVTPASVVLDPAGLTQGVADASAAVGGTSDVWNVTAGSAYGWQLSPSMSTAWLLVQFFGMHQPLMSKLRSWQLGLPPRLPALVRS